MPLGSLRDQLLFPSGDAPPRPAAFRTLFVLHPASSLALELPHTKHRILQKGSECNCITINRLRVELACMRAVPQSRSMLSDGILGMCCLP